MRFLISHDVNGSLTDVAVTSGTDATVGDLAAALATRRQPPHEPDGPAGTLAIENHYGRTTLPPDRLLADVDLPFGSIVALVKPTRAIDSLAAPRLRVVSGPQRNTTHTLLLGTTLVGRGEGSDIRLDDQSVSRSHARISVTSHLGVEVADLNSSNGITIDGAVTNRSRLTPGQLLRIGETTFSLDIQHVPTSGPRGHPRQNQFVRSPRLTPGFPEETFPTPELPKRPQKSHFPLTLLMAPLFMGAAMFALTQRLASLVFIALMPVMMIGMWFENRRSAQKQSASAWREFRSDLDRLQAIISKRQHRERLVRCEEHPSADRIVQATAKRSSLLWSRRPDKDHYLQLRLGLGSAVSRVSTSESSSGSADPRAWSELQASLLNLRRVSDVPVVASLPTCGSVGVAGAREHRDPVAYGLLLQAAGLHSPSELIVAAFLGHASVPSWDWLKWLPHTQATHSPVSAPLLTSNLGDADQLASDLESLIRDRQARTDNHVAAPNVLIVVENDCPLDHARLLNIAETGPMCGVHILWTADAVSELPAAARAFISVADSGRNLAGIVTDSEPVEPLAIERVERSAAELVARSMAPIVDVGSRHDREPDLPASVSYVGLAGSRTADEAAAVTERWLETGSMKRYSIPTARPTCLRALVGVTTSGPCVIDLASEGPHALVGGTTGSGKSELLQTWVLALASDYSPDRVNFLFVDYKGGSAFAQCVDIPHSVGLVTDLTVHLVRRALLSLRAELQRRERILNLAGAKDVEAMERSADPTTPPRLVIVVDEFAALTQEVPEFVDGVVDIAQRGRSLGLHLILATQRPTGVIKANLRANTNLRIALRMADPADASDVLGTDVAAYFDPENPGRAAVRNGPGRVTHFQTAYVGGYTSTSSGQKESVQIADFTIGTRSRTQTTAGPESANSPTPKRPIQTDLQRLTRSITQASVENDIATPRRPWMPELPRQLDLIKTTALGGYPASAIPFAMSDRPDRQQQPVVGFDPDRSGNLAIFGTGGSGKSTTLRSLAMAACLTPEQGPTHIYGLDYGSRGLAMLDPLPHVGAVIEASDVERTTRLMRTLQNLVIDRAARFAAEGAASLPEYRATQQPEETPRILVLLDGLAAFRKAHEASPMPSIYESLLVLATDGRPVGVHVIVTADRPGTLPSALASVTPAKLVLRLANENDAALLNVPKQILDEGAPPGRGVMNGAEVQVAVISGSASVRDQSRAVSDFRQNIAVSCIGTHPEPVGSLTDKVELADLPQRVGDAPTLGLADDTLLPIGFPLGGPLIVTGPPGSGRTTTVASMVRSFLRMGGDRRAVLLSPGATPLAVQIGWNFSAQGVDEVAELSQELIRPAANANDGNWLFVLEDVALFVNGAADLHLQNLVRTLRSTKQTLLGEGDTQSMQSSWPLLLALRAQRRGIVLQPDQADGELLLRTPFPRLRRTEFPLGRGLLVSDGQTRRVQIAL
jgi:S-DNA-T family DNA segregation ATPase FtsK/SpoIIIE